MTDDELRDRLTQEFQLGCVLALHHATASVRANVETLRQCFDRTIDIDELDRLCTLLTEYVE